VRSHKAGAVLDQASGRPIADATVTVESWEVEGPGGRKISKKDTFTTKTDAAGRFQVPEKSEWFLVAPLPDAGPSFNQRMCVRATGYEPMVGDPWSIRYPWQYQPPQAWHLTASTHAGADEGSCRFNTRNE
jgi:hypothetical protein